MEPMDRVKKKQRPDAFVKILTAAAEGVELNAFFEQRLERKFHADRVERLIPNSRVSGRDDFDESAGHFPLIASNSTRPVITSSRSCPASAMASCAVSRPYLTPMS